MDFKQLTSFVTAVRTGSFSKAAETLFISQPGISAHIAALEKELGTVLFERSKKPLALTGSGRELYEYAQNILKLKDRMAAVGKPSERTVIHIGASTIPSACYLPDLLCRYRRSHPEASFKITRSDSLKTIRGLSEGLFDLAFTGMERPEPGISFLPVSEDRLVLIAPNTAENRDLLRNRDPRQILLSLPLILREEGSASGERLSSLTKMLGIASDKLDIAARTDDTEAILSMVSGGMGAACLSEKAARVPAEAKKILVFELPERISARKLYLAKNDLITLRPAAADLIRFTLESEGS